MPAFQFNCFMEFLNFFFLSFRWVNILFLIFYLQLVLTSKNMNQFRWKKMFTINSDGFTSYFAKLNESPKDSNGFGFIEKFKNPKTPFLLKKIENRQIRLWLCLYCNTTKRNTCMFSSFKPFSSTTFKSPLNAERWTREFTWMVGVAIWWRRVKSIDCAIRSHISEMWIVLNFGAHQHHTFSSIISHENDVKINFKHKKTFQQKKKNQT